MSVLAARGWRVFSPCWTFHCSFSLSFFHIYFFLLMNTSFLLIFCNFYNNIYSIQFNYIIYFIYSTLFTVHQELLLSCFSASSVLQVCQRPQDSFTADSHKKSRYAVCLHSWRTDILVVLLTMSLTMSCSNGLRGEDTSVNGTPKMIKQGML